MKESTITEPKSLEPQLPEIKSLLTEMQGGWTELKSLPAAVKTLQEENANLLEQLDDLRRQRIAASGLRAPRPPGSVSDECARFIAATFIQHCQRSGKLEALASITAHRDSLAAFARDSLGLSTTSALNTSDIDRKSVV